MGVYRSKTCTICLEIVSVAEKYPPLEISNCTHTTCRKCLCKYLNQIVTSSHQKDYETIKCPAYGCIGSFTSIGVVNKVFTEKEATQWWELTIKRTCISNKIYCPMENCGAVMEGDQNLKENCTFIVCPMCTRGFCSACQKVWHSEKKEDSRELEISFLRTAKLNTWARCPVCKKFVEKIAGCLHIRCLCGEDFCYRCGRLYETCQDLCRKFSDAQLKIIRDKMFSFST